MRRPAQRIKAGCPSFAATVRARALARWESGFEFSNLPCVTHLCPSPVASFQILPLYWEEKVFSNS